VVAAPPPARAVTTPTAAPGAEVKADSPLGAAEVGIPRMEFDESTLDAVIDELRRRTGGKIRLRL
jgi:hypothetical protein